MDALPLEVLELVRAHLDCAADRAAFIVALGLDAANDLSATSAKDVAKRDWVGFLELVPAGINKYFVEYACIHNAMKILVALDTSGFRDWPKDPIMLAATYGHLEMVQWLHANRSEGCTTWAMDWAAEKGHLEMVQWLHANRSEGCTTWAMDWAEKKGHWKVVRWLLKNRT
jgi:hypothetical protein